MSHEEKPAGLIILLGGIISHHSRDLGRITPAVS